MPVSTVHLTDINADPFPPDPWASDHWNSTFAPVNATYGTASANPDTLDTADFDSSYVMISSDVIDGHPEPATVELITARPGLITPTIPDGAVADQFGQALEVNAAIRVQARTLGLGRPHFIAYSSLDLGAGEFNTAAFSWSPSGSLGLDGSWIDQDDIGPPSYGYFVSSADAFLATVQDSGYFVIAPGNAFPTSDGLQFSQIVSAFAWIDEGIKWHNAFGHYAAAGSVPLQIYTPPHGWVDIVDGPG